MKILLLTFFIFISAKAEKTFKEVEIEGKNLGKDLFNTNQGKIYNETEVPGFQTANPNETQYYNNSSSLELTAKEEFSKNENAKIIVEADKQKKVYKQDAKDIRNTSEVIKETAKENTNDIYCLDGSCSSKATETSSKDGMVQVLTMFNMMQDIQKDSSKNKNNLKIFVGEVNSCTKDRAGYNNCCKIDGWGQGLGARCNAREQNLVQKRQKKQCVHVRTYCSKEIDVGLTSICTVDTQEYCCFDSNLTKIIAENGRKQLNIPWRIKKGHWIFGRMQTDCRGFTPEELQRLKLDKIDFSEFTNDLKPQINNMNPTNLSIQATENINNFYED